MPRQPRNRRAPTDVPQLQVRSNVTLTDNLNGGIEAIYDGKIIFTADFLEVAEVRNWLTTWMTKSRVRERILNTSKPP